MRPTRKLTLVLVAVLAAFCFAFAALSARELGQRSNALARQHQWQAPYPYLEPAAAKAQVEPAAPEVEPAAEEEEAPPTGAALTSVSPSAAAPEVAPTAAEIAAAIAVKLAPPPPVEPVAVAPPKKAPPAEVPAARQLTGHEVEPEDAIRMVLRQKRAAFEHCYESELRKQAPFSGFILVLLSLSSDGRVTQAKVQEGNRRDAQVGACIVAQLRHLVLPALTSEADLLIPIRLEAKEPT